jgi:hypothetical protein
VLYSGSLLNAEDAELDYSRPGSRDRSISHEAHTHTRTHARTYISIYIYIYIYSPSPAAFEFSDVCGRCNEDSNVPPEIESRKVISAVQLCRRSLSHGIEKLDREEGPIALSPSPPLPPSLSLTFLSLGRSTIADFEDQGDATGRGSLGCATLLSRDANRGSARREREREREGERARVRVSRCVSACERAIANESGKEEFREAALAMARGWRKRGPSLSLSLSLSHLAR